jgi:hypothetical protein
MNILIQLKTQKCTSEVNNSSLRVVWPIKQFFREEEKTFHGQKHTGLFLFGISNV